METEKWMELKIRCFEIASKYCSNVDMVISEGLKLYNSLTIEKTYTTYNGTANPQSVTFA